MQGEREWGKGNKINTKQMKECLSSGSYLHQKHLLYRGTTNKKVTSEQNINMAAADPHWRQRRRGMKKMAQGQKKGEWDQQRKIFIYIQHFVFQNFPINPYFFFQKKNIPILKKHKTWGIWRWQAQADVGGRAHKLFNEVNKESKPEDGEVEPGPKIRR